MGIEAVRRKYEKRLMALPNVRIVGIGEKAGRQVIKVYVTRKVPPSELQTDEVVPKMLEGYATDVEESGNISALLE